jgi:hypothetical protein
MVEMGRGQKKRSGSRGTVRRIQSTAQARQDAWAETGLPNETFRLTLELDGLYGDLRDERKGNLGEPFKGSTSAVRS